MQETQSLAKNDLIWQNDAEQFSETKDGKSILIPTSFLIIVPFVSLIFLLWWACTKPQYFSLAGEGL